MNEETLLKALNVLIKWLKTEEEFSGEIIDKLKEVISEILEMFIRLRDEE